MTTSTRSRARNRAPVSFRAAQVRRAPTEIVTVLTAAERARVDAASAGIYRPIHRDSLDDVIRDVREARAAAVVVSVNYCERNSTEPVATMVREFPRVPTFALLSELGPRTPQTILSLGGTGVRQLLDVRDPTGWRALRAALSDGQATRVQRLALERLAKDLEGCSTDCWRFFEVLFLSPLHVSTIRALAEGLGVLPGTLMSRFFRAKLPSPKRYLSMARLVRASQLFENRGFSVANIAYHLDWSSPQSFSRHVRQMLGISALEFRTQYNSERMIDRFREEMVTPHLASLRHLAPLRYQTPRTPRSWPMLSPRSGRRLTQRRLLTMSQAM